MIERPLEIVNERGLHARAAARFVKLVGSFKSKVTVSKDGNTVSGDSIMGLMMLAAATGSIVTLVVDGPDEAAAADAIAALVADGFDEE
ncbi:MAG: HPr family phosphocarrier protein [Alphaproteobacteria bacterium]|nr:HPr family phosphocarrier protein [Alphaproteobacteria bacterium]